jgi:hypothetical protein
MLAKPERGLVIFLFSCSVAVLDRTTAEDLNRLTIKIAAKVALLIRENVLKPTDKEMIELQEPLNAAARALVDGLESKPGTVDSTAAAAAVEKAFGGSCNAAASWHNLLVHASSSVPVFVFLFSLQSFSRRRCSRT